MRSGGEIKTPRLSVRDEYKFENTRARSPAREARVHASIGKKAKCPDEKLKGHLVLATSY
jgi:hypothetical protein